jgi:hypothetical protein
MNNFPLKLNYRSSWAGVTSLFVVVAYCCTLATTINTVSGFASPSLSRHHHHYQNSPTMIKAYSSDEYDSSSSSDTFLSTRRGSLKQTAAATAAAVFAVSVVVAPQSAFAAAPANAAAATTSSSSTKQEILSKLAGIPTFCLVNENGIPFVIFDRSSATGTGYFFLTKEIALQALDSARRNDSSKGAEQIWNKAQIKVVPLSIALQLSLTKRRRTTVNEEDGVRNIQVDTIHLLIPGDDGNKDAQRLDTSRNNNPKKWETKGRVPLFNIKDPVDGHQYYSFETNDLINEYKKRNTNDLTLINIPPIEVRELVADTYRKAAISGDWNSLEDFVNSIHPIPESSKNAIELLQMEIKSSKTGSITPYNFDQAYLVSAGK